MRAFCFLLTLGLIAATPALHVTNTADGDHDAIVLLQQYLAQHHVPAHPGSRLRVISTCSMDQRCHKAPFLSDDYLKYPMRVACYATRCYWINLAKRSVTRR